METADKKSLFGILAEFTNPAELVKAAKAVSQAGYNKFDTYSPFPIHGMDEAMGLKKSKVGWVVLLFGLTGFLGAISLMVYVMVFNYPLNISGKPFLNVPIYVPITFELTVLLSAFGAITAILALNKLPKLYNPLFNSTNFQKATDDGFFLCIESSDALFSEEKTVELFKENGAKSIEKVYD